MKYTYINTFELFNFQTFINYTNTEKNYDDYIRLHYDYKDNYWSLGGIIDDYNDYNDYKQLNKIIYFLIVCNRCNRCNRQLFPLMTNNSFCNGNVIVM